MGARPYHEATVWSQDEAFAFDLKAFGIRCPTT